MLKIQKYQISQLNTVEIEINTHCNRRCSYCPNSTLPVQNTPTLMSDDVFSRLLAEIVRINFRGRISYHFYNEPLLRPDLSLLVKKVKQSLPHINQVIFTNGDLLTDQKYQELVDSGVDFFQITSHSGKRYPKREKQVVYFPDQLNLSNRGGTLQHLPKTTLEIQKSRCFAPSEMLIVTATGDVLLCYEDARRQYVMGNIMIQSVDEIWYSDRFIQLRQAVSIGDRMNGASICAQCTNTGHQIEGTSHIPTP